MPALTLDWLWLCLQVVLLARIAFREVRRRSDRNLYAVLIPVAMLVLVQGQAWWIFHRFEATGLVQMPHMYTTLSLTGARWANFHLGLAVVVFALCFGAVRSNSRVAVAPLPGAPQPGPLTYTVVVIWLAAAVVLLLDRVGGLQAMIDHPGRLIQGQTVFLLALGLGKLPLMQKLANGQPVGRIDVALLAATFVLLLFNSRFLAMFVVLQLFLVLNYCRRETSRRALVGVGVMAVLVFVVFGIYRDYASIYGDAGGQWLARLAGAKDLDLIDWFYRRNVEGFTGLAGVVSYGLKEGGLVHDFGVSELAVLFYLLPNAIRTDPALPFQALWESVRTIYPYTASVVPSTFELSYGHFGAAGVLAAGAMFGLLSGRMHAWTTHCRAGGRRLLLILLSVQILNGVRGSLAFALVIFGLGDLVALVIYRAILRATAKRAAVPLP